MGNPKYIEDQNKVLKQAAIIVVSVILVFVFTSVYTAFEPALPFRGLHFLLPNSLITYFLVMGVASVFFFSCYKIIMQENSSISYFLSLFLLLDLYSAYGPLFLIALVFLVLFSSLYFYKRKFLPKGNNVLLAIVFVLGVFVVAPDNNDPYTNKYFGYPYGIAADKNNTLYIVDKNNREIIQVNPDQYLYKRIHAPELELLPDHGSYPLAYSDGNLFFASHECITILNLDTREIKRIEPENLLGIRAWCRAGNNELIILGRNADDTVLLQWYGKDDVLIREKEIGKNIDGTVQICAADDGRMFLLDIEKTVVHVLDAEGVFINAWPILDINEDSPKEALRHASMNVNAKGNLFIIIPEDGQLVKYDIQGEKTVLQNDSDAFGDIIAYGPSQDIFILDWGWREIRQLDSAGNLRYTHDRIRWMHYWAFLRNLFIGKNMKV